MGCLNKIFSNPITKIIADVAATATGNPELIPLIHGGSTLLSGGSIGDALKSGGLAFAGQELLPVAGNAFSSAFPETAASLGVTGGANSLTDLLGQTTGGGSLTGAGTLGGDILGATNAAGLTDSAGGVSSMFSRALTSGGNALGLSGGSSSLAPSVTGGTANAAPLTGSGSSGAVPSNSLASSTLSGTGGGQSSYSIGAGSTGAADISAADPSLQQGFNTPGGQSLIPQTSTGAPNYAALPSTAGNIASGTATGGSKMLGLNTLGTLLGGANSLYSNNQAQNALVSGQNKALAQLQPYLQSGGAANTQLSNLLGTSGNTGAAGYGTLGKAFTPGDLTQTPGYNFARDQGNQELDRQNAARGGYFSGGAIKAGQDFAQNLASTTYQQQLQDYLAQQQQQYGMLSGQAGVGANAANAAGTIYGNTGAARANADVANANVFGGTLGSLLGSGKTPINIGGQIVYV